MLPNKVKIGGYQYKISLKPKEEIIVDSTVSRAAIHYEINEIDIQENLGHERKIQTLFHEIQHGIDEFYRINYKKTECEELAEMLANAWSQVLLDNPELIEFIKEAANE
jgi:hypothetical protein